MTMLLSGVLHKSFQRAAKRAFIGLRSERSLIRRLLTTKSVGLALLPGIYEWAMPFVTNVYRV